MKKSIAVIGSGLAGTLLSNELNSRADVTLLEAGEKDRIRFPKIDYLGKHFAEVNTLCIAGGGTTNLWHNGLIPIHLEDVTSDTFREILSDAASYMDKAAAKLYFRDRSYQDAYSAEVARMERISERVGMFSDGIDCLIYPKKYKKLTPHPDVNAHYNVSHIDFIRSERRIRQIRYRTAGKEYSLCPDDIAICAGALNSPKLIRAILPADLHPALDPGAGFMDHPMGFVGKVKFKKDVAPLVNTLSLHDSKTYQCRTAVRLKSACGRYTACAFFRPAMTMDNRLAVYKFKSSLGASNGTRRLKSIFSPKILHPDILSEIFSHLFGLNLPTRIYNILLIAEQKRGGSSVRHNGNRIEVDWRITDDELAIYNGMLQKLQTMLSPVSDSLSTIPAIDDNWLWSAAHHSGTTSLGTTESHLVDKALRLNGCDNVYICDGSVIQEHSYANTGLTIGELALRLADTLLEQ